MADEDTSGQEMVNLAPTHDPMQSDKDAALSDLNTKRAFQVDDSINKDDHAIVFSNLNYSVKKVQWSRLARGSCTRKTIPIIRDVSGFIPRQKITAIIGQSGAGKTSLLGMLAGISKSGQSTGTVVQSSKNIAFVSQIPHIAQTETVQEILTFSCNCTLRSGSNTASDRVQLVQQRRPSEEQTGSLNNFDRKQVITKRVETVLDTLNLTRVRKRQIRYLSGGELKRVSIAMQLCTAPDILVLDEPTSGLDTPTAVTLIQTLRNTVRRLGCTVLMSIHQPHRRICDCIDWLLSMKDGQLLYMGTLPQAYECRDALLNELIGSNRRASANGPVKIGLDLDVAGKKETNGLVPEADTQVMNESVESTEEDDLPAESAPELLRSVSAMYGGTVLDEDGNIDYAQMANLITSVMSDGRRAGNAADYLLETEYLAPTETLRQHWKAYRTQLYPDWDSILSDSSATLAQDDTSVSCLCCSSGLVDYFRDFAKCATYIRAFRAFTGLTMRSLRYYYRRWWIVALNLIVSCVAAAGLGALYGELTEVQDDIQNRFGAFAFMCIFLGIEAIAAASSFNETRDVFIDDRNAKLYGSGPFLVAKIVPDLLLLRVVPAMCFGFILFHMIGLQEDSQFEFIAVLVMLAVVSSLCVFTISSLSPDAQLAGFLSIFFNMFFLLYSGVFIQDESTIPEGLRWPEYLSFYKFAFEILMVNEFEGLMFKIESTTINVGGADITFDAEQLDVKISGEFFLTFFGMDADAVSRDYMMLWIWIAGYFAVTWFALEALYRSKR